MTKVITPTRAAKDMLHFFLGGGHIFFIQNELVVPHVYWLSENREPLLKLTKEQNVQG
jgi:hypothetical protein